MRARGFSLVEVLVAGTLLGLVLTFSLRPLQTSDRAGSDALVRRRMESLAQELLNRASVQRSEQLKAESGDRSYLLELKNSKSSIDLKWKQSVTVLSENRAEIVIQVDHPTKGRPTVLKTERFYRGVKS